MKGASQIAPFGLRMPEDLKDAIAKRAADNGRSMNAEIVQILQDALSESPESLASEAIDRAYFDGLAEMNNDELEEWFKAIKEHTKWLNKATEMMKQHTKKPT